jgi:1-aminocyclopropane-1-carboxylate deaminase/D-cysteine desulfhydrase-like pyridoxal-dependent ACC family enzyme
MKECEKGTFDDYKKILFIHTGGIFGLLSQSNGFT